MRCHTHYPEGKDQNLIISNSVAGAYLLDYWLESPNVHRLLIPGQLTNPALTNMPYLIFLWTEISQRDPIPMVNPLLKIVYIFWKVMGFTLIFGFTKI